MIVKSSSAKQRIVGPVKIREYPINEKFSASLIELDGAHRKIKCLKEDRTYFVIEGNGKFSIDDQPYEVSKGDLVFIPKETPYRISGKIKLFVVYSPAFDSKNIIFLE
jgi:mannose-6-phosphate isomerase-like protein (cupin superfamily)